MSLDNCPLCGKLFMKSPGHISCMACRQKEEEVLARFRAFFDEHGGSASLQDVIAGTGIDEKLIRKFLEGDRLVSTTNPLALTRCQECKRVTDGASLCPDCLKRKSQPPKSAPSPGKSQRTPGISHELRTDQWSNKRH